VRQLIDAEDYATAARLLAAMRPAAASAGDAAITEQLQTLARENDALRTASSAIAKDLEKLKSTPDDPAANLAVGRFLCFTKGDWPRGLPLLAKGSDAALKAAAQADIAEPSEASEQVLVADKWWDLATKEPSAPRKQQLRQRAAYWYEKAGPGLTSLRKTMAEQRLADIRKADAAGAESSGPPPASHPVPAVPPSPSPFPPATIGFRSISP
jgi:hypothetical protein